MMTSFACLLSCFLIGFDEGIDKASLLGLLDSAYAPLQDLSCEYEGEMILPSSRPPKIVDANGVFDRFTGAFAERRDGAILVDIYHRYTSDDKDITRETIAIIGGRCETYVRNVDRRGGNGQVAAAHYKRPDVLGSMAKILCDSMLIGYLRDNDWDMVHENTENIDGNECIVVKFHFKANPSVSVSERFWIDLKRGGHVLKRERIKGNSSINKTFDISLMKFKDDGNHEVWVPVSGVWEAYGSVDKEQNVTYGTAATNRETYYLLKESLRLNTKLKDDRFSINYRSGTVITDQLRRVQYEFGQTGPANKKVETRADSEAVLKEQLRLAQEQGDELRASSWERSGPNWGNWVPWLGVGCWIILLAGIWIRRRIA